ncbi:MAG: hypothetical protein AABX66_02440 [Nanoarchaeota archaeon]
MQTIFKRHQLVKILVSPDKEFIEQAGEEETPVEIKKGMTGKINMILPDGKYHVAIIDQTGKVIAYAPFDQDALATV